MREIQTNWLVYSKNVLHDKTLFCLELTYLYYSQKYQSTYSVIFSQGNQQKKY
jgi:hypothetical protein